MGLTNKQRVFIEEYLQCWNATEAALRAGYSKRSAQQIGSENLLKPVIAEEIKARLKDLTMSADEVLARLTKQARGAPEDFIELQAGLPFLNWEKLVAAGKLDLIKKFSYDKDGHPVVEFYDAQTALVQLGRAQKLFTDVTKVVGGGENGALIINIGTMTGEHDDT